VRHLLDVVEPGIANEFEKLGNVLFNEGALTSRNGKVQAGAGNSSAVESWAGAGYRRITMSDVKRVAWILGSGFSRGLGGPLLEDLLSERGKSETHVQYARLPNRDLVYRVFHHYGPASHVKFWQHAEDFLDFVDAAKEPESSTRRQLLERLVRGQGGDQTPLIEDFRKLAILAVAAECSTFVDRGDVRSEAWQPYVEWAGKLGERDTIVTFNYDRVIEKLGAEFVNARETAVTFNL